MMPAASSGHSSDLPDPENRPLPGAVTGNPATHGVIPAMPPIGKPEAWYAHKVEEADRAGDLHAHEGFKVGQYISLASSGELSWEDKLRYYRHALKRHCIPPRLADDALWSYYKDLEHLVKDHAGEEALRLASLEDDRWCVMADSGHNEEEIADLAEAFFDAMIPGDHCPEWFHEEDYHQLCIIRDQWM